MRRGGDRRDERGDGARRALARAGSLALVVHALVLVRLAYWSTPLGLALAGLMAAGSVAAGTSIAGRIGRARRVRGRIEAIERSTDGQAIAVTVRLAGPWAGHAAGQFAFVAFDAAEGPHPFTIASAWAGDARLVFAIKALGDYTRALPRRLRVGDAVGVEGPYGRFDFAGRAPRQVWVAGGIGITPFLARLQALAGTPPSAAQAAAPAPQVDLVYCTRAADASFLARLAERAKAAGVRLHVLDEVRDGRLDARRLAALVPQWAGADLWFCGPAAFGQALRRGLRARGLRAGAFHQELFELR